MDNDIRLKRALKERIHPSNSIFYEPGDKLYFKEEGKHEWSGPAKVIGMDGKVLFVKYGNKTRRVHSSKAVPECIDYEEGEWRIIVDSIKILPEERKNTHQNS